MFSSDGSKIETYCQFNDQHCRVSVVIKAGVMQFTRPSHNFALCAMFQHVKAINKLIIVYNNALFRTLLLGALYPLCMSRLCPSFVPGCVTPLSHCFLLALSSISTLLELFRYFVINSALSVYLKSFDLVIIANCSSHYTCRPLPSNKALKLFLSWA